MTDFWKNAPQKMVKTIAGGGRSWGNSNFGTGHTPPAEDGSSFSMKNGGNSFHAAVRFQFPNPGAGTPCKAHPVIAKK
jgi:hypothetical protein